MISPIYNGHKTVAFEDVAYLVFSSKDPNLHLKSSCIFPLPFHYHGNTLL